jgi:hypothetical protein
MAILPSSPSNRLHLVRGPTMTSCLRRDGANQINVVIEMADEIVVDILDCTTCVSYEFAFRHLVLDVWTGQVDG